MIEDEVVATAEAVVPVITEYRDEGERDAHVATEVCKAVGEAGLFRLCAPREVGGHEPNLPTIAEVFRVLGAADPALACKGRP